MEAQHGKVGVGIVADDRGAAGPPVPPRPLPSPVWRWSTDGPTRSAAEITARE
jgi:hypothetical protein